jgi:tetratricopeptide (TPR) repeat protein
MGLMQLIRPIAAMALLASLAAPGAAAQSVEEWIARGRSQLDSNKADAAVKSFERAVKADEKNSDAHLWLARAVGTVAGNANVLRQPFLAKRAKSEFDKAAELDPNSVGAREGLMQFYLRAPGVMGGSINKAREEAAKIAQLNPYRGHFAANQIANNQKDLAAAEKNWRAFYAAYPDSVNPMTNLTAFLINNGRAEEAWPVVEKFLARHPDNVLGQWWFVRTSAATGKQMDKAEQFARTLLAIPAGQSPRVANDALHFRLGEIHAKRGDKAKAKAEYEEALRVNPKHEGAKKALASP